MNDVLPAPHEVRSKRPRHIALAALLVIALVIVAWTGLIWPRRPGAGEPFSDHGGGTLGLTVSAGQRFVFLNFFGGGPASGTITVQDLISSFPSDHGPVRLLDIALAVRRPGEPFVVPSFYRVDPGDDWRDCDGQFLVDPDGYEVQPGEHVLVAFELEALKPTGKVHFEPSTIVFKRGWIRYRSHPGNDVELTIEKRFGSSDLSGPSWASACAHPDGTFFVH